MMAELYSSMDLRLDPGPVLITGAAGFVGQHLMNELQLGEGDIAADVSDGFPAPEGVRKISWRLPSPPPAGLGEVRYILHLAAVSSVSRSMSDIQKAYEVNLMGTIAVLEYMVSRSPDARMLLVSSAEVYRPSDEILSESSPIGPLNPYGATKAAAETAASQMAGNFDLDIVVARPFPHIGPGQEDDFAFPSFCRRIIQAGRTGDLRVRVGNLSPVRDYLYVDDVTRAYRHILSRGRSGSVYNICSGRGISVGDMLEMLVEISGCQVELETDPELVRPVDVEFQVGDPSRITALLGWKPEVEIFEALRRLFSWWEAKA